MGRETPKALKQRFERAWVIRDQWRTMHEDAFAYAMPVRNQFTDFYPGQEKTARLYDSTLQTSTYRSANRLQGVLTPPGSKWAMLVPGDVMNFLLGQDKNERHRVVKLLDAITDACFAIIRASNFDSAINEFYLDLLVGTGAMLVLKTGNSQRPIVFVAVPLHQLALEEGVMGEIGSVYRKYKVTRRNLEGTFPGEFLPPPNWEKALMDQPDEEVEVVECTYSYEGKWYYDVLLCQWGTEIARVVERDMDESPWVVARWAKLAGESFGRGPILNAVADAKVLNKLKELVLKNASLAIQPPLRVIDDGVINFSTLRIVPGALLPVARNAGALGPSIEPLITGSNFDVASLVAPDLHKSIQDAMLDSELPEGGEGVRSATEYMARLREVQNDTSAPYGRLHEELIRRLFQVLLYYMDELGILSSIMKMHGFPSARLHVNGIGVDVKLLGPLAQAHNLDKFETLSQALSFLAQLAPAMLERGVRMEDVPSFVWELFNLDPKLLRDPTEMAMMGMQQEAMNAVAATAQQ